MQHVAWADQRDRQCNVSILDCIYRYMYIAQELHMPACPPHTHPRVGIPMQQGQLNRVRQFLQSMLPLDGSLLLISPPPPPSCAQGLSPATLMGPRSPLKIRSVAFGRVIAPLPNPNPPPPPPPLPPRCCDFECSCWVVQTPPVSISGKLCRFSKHFWGGGGGWGWLVMCMPSLSGVSVYYCKKASSPRNNSQLYEPSIIIRPYDLV